MKAPALLLLGILLVFQASATAQAGDASERLDAERGIALYREGNYADARLALERAVEGDPSDLRSWQDLGWTLYRLGETNQATRVWQDILVADPTSIRARKTVNVMDGGTLNPGQLPMPGGSDRDNYQAAFELLKEQRYEPAALAFQQFLVTFPDSELADNAQYWLAESHYVTQQFDQALSEFEVVIGTFPESRKVPDALLKMGYCSYELERWDNARAALTRVQVEYPETTAARLAGQRLQRMDEEGV